MTERLWRVFSAASIGKGHIDGGLPCQDAAEYAFGKGWLVAVVCDGAGSAAKSDVGAQACARAVCRVLAGVEGVPSTIKPDLIAQAIVAARADIQSLSLEHAIEAREFACTVVGIVLSRDGGALFHIGDGMAVVELSDGAVVLSSPENGEYANETYFVTGGDWQAHLRMTPFEGQIRRAALMSDGVVPFAISRSKTGLFAPFIDPVATYLAGVDEGAGSEALQATLADERTWEITQDDKSLIVILPS